MSFLIFDLISCDYYPSLFDDLGHGLSKPLASPGLRSPLKQAGAPGRRLVGQAVRACSDVNKGRLACLACDHGQGQEAS